MTLLGNYTALVTPFLINGQIDFTSLQNLVRYQIHNKTEGIVALGSTAETSSLDGYEKHKVMETVLSITENKTKVIAGVNAFSLDNALLQCHQRFIDGADALLISPPPYIKPTKKGLDNYFLTLADQSYIPIILYNIPSRTGISIPINSLERLSSHPNIIGIKEASGDMNYSTQITQFISNKFSLLAGNDNLLLPLLSIGATGIISVIGNILPSLCSQTISLYTQNKAQEAKTLYFSQIDLINALSLESNPICIKYILNKLGMIKQYYRKPLCPPSKQTKIQLNNHIKKTDIF